MAETAPSPLRDIKKLDHPQKFFNLIGKHIITLRDIKAILKIRPPLKVFNLINKTYYC